MLGHSKFKNLSQIQTFIGYRQLWFFLQIIKTFYTCWLLTFIFHLIFKLNFNIIKMINPDAAERRQQGPCVNFFKKLKCKQKSCAIIFSTNNFSLLLVKNLLILLLKNFLVTLMKDCYSCQDFLWFLSYIDLGSCEDEIVILKMKNWI